MNSIRFLIVAAATLLISQNLGAEEFCYINKDGNRECFDLDIPEVTPGGGNGAGGGGCGTNSSCGANSREIDWMKDYLSKYPDSIGNVDEFRETLRQFELEHEQFESNLDQLQKEVPR